MPFDANKYGTSVAGILKLAGNGERLMPLAGGTCSSQAAKQALESTTAAGLFARARAPEAAMSGLWLYFSCLDESHALSQDIPTVDGSFWHGILHRQEPDAGNAAYWFRRVGKHPVFPQIAEAAAGLCAGYPAAGFRASPQWDPLAFIDFCETARLQPDSPAAQLALRIQRAEWQILFDYCASPAA